MKKEESRQMDQFGEAWEHLIVTLEADAHKHADYLRSRWPNRTFPVFAPQALIPELDEISKKGWELVALQPVIMGDNGDMHVIGNGGIAGNWTRRYLCTFKRRARHGTEQSDTQAHGRVSGPLPPLEDE